MKRKGILAAVIVVAIAVVAALFEPTGVVRGFVRGEPFYEGRPASTWALRLNDANPRVKEDAQRSLKTGGAASVPVLAAIAKAPNSDWASVPVRVMAIDILANIGPAADSAIPALLGALADRDSVVRSQAAAALGAVGPNDDGALSALIAELATPNALAATKALVRCGPASVRGTPGLVKLLSNEDPEIRWNAVKTIGKIHAVDAIDPLIGALKDPADSVREHAAEALGDLGPAAAKAVEPLMTTLQDPYFKARRDAARSLGQIGPAAKAAIPTLEKLSKDDPQTIVREAAALAVKKIAS
jgi:HEAT repeat protein